MRSRSNLVYLRSDGSRETWEPTTLDQVGKNEQFLETVITESPELLCLQTKRTGIYGPYVVLRQRALSTPQARSIIPDLLILAASGNLIVVEVKLFSNPELRDRRVLAQAIDYVASISALDEDQLVQLVNRRHSDNPGWFDLIARSFPGEEDPEELAQVFIDNVKKGDLNIVIACDRVPVGLHELAQGVSRQSALGFTMDIVEVTPYIRIGDPGGGILFGSHTKLTTEIVSRTAVNVTYQQGTPRPSVDVSTTSIDEIEQSIQSASQGVSRSGRLWSDEETDEAFMGSDDPVVRDLYLFAKQHSHEGQVTAQGRKVSPSFGFYVKGFRSDGTERTVQAFNCVEGSGRIKLYLNMVRTIAEPHTISEYSRRLTAILGNDINTDQSEPYVDTTAVADSLDEFKQLMLWLQQALLQ